jgi:hypothetical protein
LVFEENGTEIVEFGHDSDEFLVLFQLYPLEKVGQDAVVALEQLEVDCGVEG